MSIRRVFCRSALAVILAAPFLGKGADSTLVAYWDFNDDSDPSSAEDVVRGRVGEFRGATAYTPDQGGFTGQAGDRAVDFGTSGATAVYVEDGRFMRMAGYADSFTISFWQKLHSVTSSSAFWATSPSSNDGQRGAQAHVPWGDQTIYYDTSGCCGADTQRISRNIADLDPAFDWTQWHHFAFVKDGQTKQIYIDGMLFHEGLGDPLPTDFEHFVIGGNDVIGNNMRGVIDDFAVWSIALTPDQIANLASQSATPLSIPAPIPNPDSDPDGDGLTNAEEFDRATNPQVADTDGDGLKDGVETNTGIYVDESDTGTDPVRADTDGDGLLDSVENNSGTFVDLSRTGTSPFNPDTDGDGFPDGVEALLGSNPLDEEEVPVEEGGLNLLAYWTFDQASTETVADTVNGIVGHLENGAVISDGGFGVSGQASDRALDLGFSEGPHAAMRVASGYFLNAASPADQLTITAFMQLYDLHNGALFFATSPSSSGGARGFAAFPWSNENIYFDSAGCCDLNTQRINAHINTFPGYTGDIGFWNSWHHFAFVKDGERKQVWIDGELFLEGTSTSPLPDDFAQLFIGNDPPDSTSIWGLVDNFAVFASALNGVQIAALADGAHPSELAVDSDSDGMPDIWEEAYSLNPDDPSDAEGDADNDGLTNLREYQLGTLPNNPDTDGDGLKDGVETNTGIWVSADDTGTDPRNVDSDGDGLPDGVETNTGTFVNAQDTGTDPNKPDTDGDTVPDSVEVAFGTDPNDKSDSPVKPGALNLLAFWDFNDPANAELARDALHGFEGSIENGAYYTPDQGGRSGQSGDYAVDFGWDIPGVMYVDDAAWLNAAAAYDQLSVSFWQMLWSPANSSAFWLVSPSSTGTERGFQAHVPWGDGTIYFDTAGCCDGPQRISRNIGDLDPAFDWLTWHHFVFVKNGGTKQIFVDGELFHSGTGAAPLPTDFTRFTVGAAGDGASSINGIIDDFALFASALTPEEIQLLAGGTSPDDLPERVISDEEPSLTLTVGNDGTITISTDGAALQHAESVTGPWEDLPETSVTVNPAAAGGARFYRGRN